VRLPTLVNPLMQDWIYFPAWSLARRYGEYDRFIQSLNPQAVLEGNPNLNAAMNKGFIYGIDPPPAQMSYNFSNQYWRLSKDARQLVGTARKVAGGPLDASVNAPPSVAGERPEVKRVPGGLLGAEYTVENGRYRINSNGLGLGLANTSPGKRYWRTVRC